MDDWEKDIIPVKDIAATEDWEKDITPVAAAEEYDEEPSQLEAILRGGIQGLTLDFGDEIGAGIGSMFSNKTYRELVEKIREDNRRAEEAYPKTALAAEIAGGVLPGLLTGGGSAVAAIGKTGLKQAMKQGAKAGAKYGGLYGLGSSEADIMGGEVAEAVQDTATGAISGGLLGGALPPLTQSIGKGARALGEAMEVPFKETAKFGKEAYKMAKKGEKFVKDKFTPEIVERQTKATGDLLKANEKSMDIAKQQIGKIINKGDDINFSDSLNNVTQMLDDKIADFGIHTDMGKQARTMKGVINHARSKAIKRSEGDNAIVTTQEMFDMWKQTKEIIHSGGGVNKDTADYLKFADDMETILLSSLNPKSREQYIKLMEKLKKSYDIKNYLQYRGPKLGDGPIESMDVPRLSAIEGSADTAEKFSRLSDPMREMSKRGTAQNIDDVMGAGGTEKFKQLEESSTLLDLATRGQKEIQKSVETGKLPKAPLSIKGGGVVAGAIMGNAVRGASALKKAALEGSMSFIKEASKASPEVFNQLAQKAANSAKYKTMSKSFQKLAEASPDRRKALLFVLSQREGFRDGIAAMIGMDKDK